MKGMQVQVVIGDYRNSRAYQIGYCFSSKIVFFFQITINADKRHWIGCYMIFSLEFRPNDYTNWFYFQARIRELEDALDGERDTRLRVSLEVELLIERRRDSYTFILKSRILVFRVPTKELAFLASFSVRMRGNIC